MSTHDDIFDALGDAIAAYRREPKLRNDLLKTTEDLQLSQMELEEARATIDRLRATGHRLDIEVLSQAGKIEDMAREIADFSDRNSILAQSLTEANAVIRNHELTISEQKQVFDIKAAQINELELKLSMEKTLTTRFKEMLQGFGSAIQSVVAEPEVSEKSAPFPSNPVGVSNPPQPSEDIADHIERLELRSLGVDMAKPERMEPVVNDADNGSHYAFSEPSESFKEKEVVEEEQTFRGCATAPLDDPENNPVGMSTSTRLTDIAPSLDSIGEPSAENVDMAKPERMEPVDNPLYDSRNPNPVAAIAPLDDPKKAEPNYDCLPYWMK